MSQEPVESRSVHPRRPPAHLSVSLRHDSPAESDSSIQVHVHGDRSAQEEFDEARVPSRRQDSDETNGSAQSRTGRQWFDRSNKHKDTRLGQKFIDSMSRVDSPSGALFPY
jgi:hypothetical protein